MTHYDALRKFFEMKAFVILLLVVSGLVLAAEEPARLWTDLNGKTIKASFVRFDGKEIVIRRVDGKLFKVYPSVFSDKDRKYLYELSTLFRSNEPVHFKDAKLEAIVRETLRKAKGGTPEDPKDATPPVSRLEMTTLRDLTTSPNAKISDLTGLEYAINLSKLSLGFNQITELKPLAKLSKLKRLDLKYNHLTDISLLAGLTNLEYLALHGNRIPEDQKKMLKKALPDCKIKF
ncbi:MAG: leucine-rich repeat domain-containing protein [Opitutales bacterium]